MKIIIMSASHEILPSSPPLEKFESTDISVSYTLRERWDMSGETFPARVVNSLGRVLNYIGNIDSEAQPCHEYYADKPNTLRERASRIRAGLNPNLLLLKLGHFISDFELDAKDSLKELRGQDTADEEHRHQP